MLQTNTTKIPREDTQRDKKSENGAGEGKNSAKFWAPHPSGRHPSLLGPTFSGFGPPTLRGPHPSVPHTNFGQKLDWPKMRMAKNGLAKNGLSLAEHIYHVGNSHDLHSIVQSGLILGGKISRKGDMRLSLRPRFQCTSMIIEKRITT